VSKYAFVSFVMGHERIGICYFNNFERFQIFLCAVNTLRFITQDFFFVLCKYLIYHSKFRDIINKIKISNSNIVEIYRECPCPYHTEINHQKTKVTEGLTTKSHFFHLDFLIASVAQISDLIGQFGNQMASHQHQISLI